MGKKILEHLADHRSSPQPASDQHFEAWLCGVVLDEPQADVVHLGDGTVVARTGHRDLELAGQVGEFRVQGRPLAQQLAVRAGVGDLVLRHAGQMVAGDVANAVSAGLDGVHVHRGEVGENVRYSFQGGPVELDVLAGGEVAVPAVVAGGDGGEHPELPRGQDPVGDRDPQHGCMALDVEPVHETKGLERFLVELSGEVASRLLAKVGHSFLHELPIVGVVLVHGRVDPVRRKKKAATRFPGWRLSGVR